MQNLNNAILVNEMHLGQRLDNFLLSYLKDIPKSCVYRLIRTKKIRVNKKRSKPEYRLMENDAINIPLNLINEQSASNNIRKNKMFAEDRKRGTGDTRMPAGDRKMPAGEKRVFIGDKLKYLGEELINSIIFESKGLLIINKPAHLAVHGGSGVNYGVIELLRHLDSNKYANLELVHRLDKETSGCLMLAKTRSTLRYMHELLANRQITKSYLALVNNVPQNNFTVNLHLFTSRLSNGERIVKVSNKERAFKVLHDKSLNYNKNINQHKADSIPKNAITHFKILSSNLEHQVALLEAIPKTGRTHQIRVHAANAGYPIIGDTKYNYNNVKMIATEIRSHKDNNKNNANSKNNPNHQNNANSKNNANRMLLHANSLEFMCYESKSLIKIVAPLDRSFTDIMLGFNLKV